MRTMGTRGCLLLVAIQIHLYWNSFWPSEEEKAFFQETYTASGARVDLELEGQ